MDAVDNPLRLPPMWRRVALVMSLAVLAALAAACWSAVHALSTQIDRDDSARVRGLAAQFVPVLRGRLETADAWVRYVATPGAGGDAGSSAQLLRQRALASGALSGVVLAPWNDAAGASGAPGHFTAADRLALTGGRSVLTVVPDQRSHAAVYLAHLVSVAGSQQVGLFEVAPAWLWRGADTVPGGMVLAVMDAHGGVVFAGTQLPPGASRLFTFTPIDPRDPTRPVLQGWQQGGAEWRAAVAQMQLDAPPIAGDSVWNIAVYDQATDSRPALLALAPAMLALLPLGALCVLLGAWYLSRRWQPALTQLHAALDALPGGAFTAVETGRATGAPRLLVQAYNRAVRELQSRFTAQGQLAEIDRLLLQAGELEQALEPIMVRVRDLCGAQAVAVALVDRDAAAHARSFLVGADGAHCPISRVHIDEEVEQQLRESPQGLAVPAHHLGRYGFLEPLRELGAKSCCAWPVMLGERIAAILSVACAEAAAPSPLQLARGAECAGRLQTAMGNAERGERLYHQAHFDSLTALPNRLLFHDR
ncbi:MAG: GAF domain-containing protein, partial [Steroidobacteraceae bacterium]